MDGHAILIVAGVHPKLYQPAIARISEISKDAGDTPPTVTVRFVGSTAITIEAMPCAEHFQLDFRLDATIPTTEISDSKRWPGIPLVLLQSSAERISAALPGKFQLRAKPLV